MDGISPEGGDNTGPGFTTVASPHVAPANRAEPLSSTALLRGRRHVEIEHNGEVYRLQTTRLGKLILTK